MQRYSSSASSLSSMTTGIDTSSMVKLNRRGRAQDNTGTNHTCITISGFEIYLQFEDVVKTFLPYGFLTPNSKHVATNLKVRRVRFGVKNIKLTLRKVVHWPSCMLLYQLFFFFSYSLIHLPGNYHQTLLDVPELLHSKWNVTNEHLIALPDIALHIMSI